MTATINQPPLYLFSKEHMPTANKNWVSSEKHWFGIDTEDRYKKAPHPSLGPQDIIYKFNAHGFRCPEFSLAETDTGALKVITIGASEVVGIGLPEDKTFAHLLCQHLEQDQGRPVLNFNLGVGGSSADSIFRILMSALPILKPDIVVMVFPFYGRREHIGGNGRIFDYNRNDAENRLKNLILDPENHSQIQANFTLSNDYNDQINYYKNYFACAALCQQYGVMWLYSAYQMSFIQAMEDLINPAHLVKPGLGELKAQYKDDPVNGLARDMGHPGIYPHRDMARLFFEGLKKRYPEKFAD